MYALGALGDDMAESFTYDPLAMDPLESSSDPHTTYAAWVAAVKAAGGSVSVAPHYKSEPVADPSSGQLIGGGQPIVSAMYPVAVVFPNAPATTLAPAFSQLPDDWSNDGKYVFYFAPPAVQSYTDTTTGGEITHPQSVPGEPAPPKPDWFAKYEQYLKYGAYGLVALLALQAISTVSSVIPRGRR